MKGGFIMYGYGGGYGYGGCGFGSGFALILDCLFCSLLLVQLSGIKKKKSF